MTSDTPESHATKLPRFESTLQQFLDRLADDRSVLAVVLNGSLTEETIWRRDSLSVWIIEADGVSRRLLSDGTEDRLFRILVENDINIHAEMIPRSRFKQMVEGSSRTAFSCNFFAARRMVYCRDASIETWFLTANTIAAKDQERELLTFSTWTIHAHRHAWRRLVMKQDLELAAQSLISAAHSVAHLELIRHGEVFEGDVIYRAIERNAALFQSIYLDLLHGQANENQLTIAWTAVGDYLERHAPEFLRPLTMYLKKEDRVVSLSELSDHFAHSQVYPWHLEATCEWLVRQGQLEKLSAPFKLTKRSAESVEEPAYLLKNV